MSRAPRLTPDMLALQRLIEKGHEDARADREATRELVAMRFDALTERTSRLERDSAKGEISDASMRREMGEIRLAIADLRDLVVIKADDAATGQNERVVAAATSGAAKGSAQGAMDALKNVKGDIRLMQVLGGVVTAAGILAAGKGFFNWLLSLWPGGGGNMVE